MAETSLHKQLKEIYAGDEAQTEVVLGDYRIDAISDNVLIEIQHGSLGAIRDKIAQLLDANEVLVVKPIIRSKMLVKLDAKGGDVVQRRRSPKQSNVLSLFDELVYFTSVFPHPNLTLEAVLVAVEEWRYPGHGKRRRRRARDHQVDALKLAQVHKMVRFHDAADLLRILPESLPRSLPEPFHTGHLAKKLKIKRWDAQRIAYCLRETGVAENVGKQGNTLLYSLKTA